MSAGSQYKRTTRLIVALVAVVFGIATVVAGGRVLGGGDPGYVVFRPLLIFNTAMGAAYVAAGIVAWRHLDRGRYAAAAILALNVVVLGIIGYFYVTGGGVAIDSVRAMTFRTVVWLVIFLALAWTSRESRAEAK